jgi:hypothetical protein
MENRKLAIAQSVLNEGITISSSGTQKVAPLNRNVLRRFVHLVYDGAPGAKNHLPSPSDGPGITPFFPPFVHRNLCTQIPCNF